MGLILWINNRPYAELNGKIRPLLLYPGSDLASEAERRKKTDEHTVSEDKPKFPRRFDA